MLVCPIFREALCLYGLNVFSQCIRLPYMRLTPACICSTRTSPPQPTRSPLHELFSPLRLPPWLSTPSFFSGTIYTRSFRPGNFPHNLLNFRLSGVLSSLYSAKNSRWQNHSRASLEQLCGNKYSTLFIGLPQFAFVFCWLARGPYLIL